MKKYIVSVLLSVLVAGFAMAGDNEFYPPVIGSFSNLQTYVWTNGTQPRVLVFVKLLSQAAVTSNVYIVNSAGWTNATVARSVNNAICTWAATNHEHLLWKGDKVQLAKGAATNKNTRFVLHFKDPTK